ncbi:MAG: peptidyl-tRNA hydrolase [Methanocalculus sp. MSAO_Arc1]|uniref:peptidyl-tRNA hydrolase Pth2 n=1 Tax=Methanocalculus TaxID=71151 RepID=UPI000FEF7EC8|nr:MULTISPECIES: peptidyl-tRNA hydrolase Pth2 [unclassified Methanocalculus]MCP1662525.1 PTH2 family peptidyl-tRNA hydrolase [Methanocalculus sp. AMF5]RQD81271.1 MAG: peptidyl-tRNA hydrolase [Methanocalculus sp. MSAO_Arc1]
MSQSPEFVWKQCLIIRDDLKMSCGKKCAQLAHAAVGASEKATAASKRAWMDEGQKKVALKATGERALFELKVIAEANSIPTSIIQDAGLTEIPPGTVTALGLGPAKSEILDRITAELKLL